MIWWRHDTNILAELYDFVEVIEDYILKTSQNPANVFSIAIFRDEL